MTTFTESSALEMLALPRVITLDAPRRDGQVCVWCQGTPALDLGPRVGDVNGFLKQFFPRACQPCASREAARVARIHHRSCRRCAPGLYCPDSRALENLAQTGATP